METVKVKVINKSKNELNNKLPGYETENSAGMDVRANFVDGESYILREGERVLVPTGLFAEIPQGYEIQVRPRSGLAYKKGITVLNSPGTIDSDYRGEIGVILINHSEEDFEIKNGERIGQIVLSKYERIEWEEALELSETDRGEGGFGSTGKK